MKYKDFYREKLSDEILEHIDDNHRLKMDSLIQRLNNDMSWTNNQKKRQISSILSNIALYQLLIENNISKTEAKELVREYSYYRAHKFNKILKTFFYIPGFFRVFSIFMKKGMKGEEIWKSRILTQDREEFSMDVLKCLWADTCRYFDCYEICEIFCLCDHIVFGNIDKLEFIRSQTLGMDGEKCDFCFKSKR